MTKSVVITGVSTGIGHASARSLLARGFRVFGSLRDPSDASRLAAEFGPAFTALAFDVTDPGAVAAAASTVRDALGDATLSGLVNNAGIAVPGPLLELPLAAFQHQLAVNVTGTLIVTRAFAPLLGTDRSRTGPPGRIVMLSSVGGTMAWPFLGAYNTSKFALEGFSEALRREMMLFGIDVVIIRPGPVATAIWEKSPPPDALRRRRRPLCRRQCQTGARRPRSRQARPRSREDRRSGGERAHGPPAARDRHPDAEPASSRPPRPPPQAGRRPAGRRALRATAAAIGPRA